MNTAMSDLPTMRTVARPTCCLCGSAGVQLYADLQDCLFGVPGNWSLTKCSNDTCGLIWLDPMPVAEELWKAYAAYYTHADPAPRTVSRWDRFVKQIGEGYLAWRYGYRSENLPWWARALSPLIGLHPVVRANLEFSVFYLNARQGARLLEVGFGSGEMLEAMRGRGWNAEGVDFDPSAVSNARRKGLKVHLGTVEEQQFPDASFDAIVMSHVIEHVPDPHGLLAECRRLLKAQGKLVAVTPNTASWGHVRYERFWRGLEPPRHCHVFNCRALGLLARKAGFEDFRVFTTVRDANGMFLASRRIRDKSLRSATQTPFTRRDYRQARFMQLAEWAVLNAKPHAGEEAVLIANR